MSEQNQRCAATTKTGAQCKNNAKHGSEYCGVHQSWTQSAVKEAAPKSGTMIGTIENDTGQSVEIQNAPPKSADTTGSTPSMARTSFEILASQLNALAAEIQKSVPDYVPPVFTPDGLITLVKGNLEKFTPDMQIEILSELRGNLEGTSPRDLIDPDTWKGLWYILNYTAQAQSKAALERVWVRLAALPGMALLSDLRGNLAGTSPKEFLDPDTWKGLWLVMNYSVQATVADLKRKLDCEDEE